MSIVITTNDGSLEFGGIFDAGTSDRKAKPCHVSHKLGVDIDVNSGYAIWTKKLDENGEVKISKTTGKPIMVHAKNQPNCGDVKEYSLNCYVEIGKYKSRMKRRDILDDIVEKKISGLRKIKEDPLHYRAE